MTQTQTVATRRAKGSSHTLLRFLARRAVTSVILLFGIVLVTFSLTVIVPGDPVRAALGEGASSNPATVAAFEAKYGLDQPIPVRFFLYVGNLLRGDLGTSMTTERSVSEDLAKAVPATAEVAFYAIIISLAVAIVLGTLAAYRRGKATDQVVRVLTLIGLSIPTFWMAILCYQLFFMNLHWVRGSGRISPTITPPPRITGFYTIDYILSGDPVGFADAASHLALPVLVLSLFTIATLTRFVRTSVLEVLDMDYARAARAKGLSGRRVVIGYVLRGAALPILTLVGIAFGSLLSGTVLVEAVFAWPGLGTYAYNASKNLDLLAVTGVGLIVGIIFLVINLVVDVLYGFLDPRVRLA
ncbi:ABC transporter permease [Microbacterium sp.]|uniref:ABC transporter permease n=1 Tax=Microbacterium sp. TaxID=51671 RepID=UPI0039E41F46